MTVVKWSLYATLALAVAALLHYSLPQREIAYITGQEVKRMDTTVQTPDGQEVQSRDVAFIYTVNTEGVPHAYRNEDTDFSWPPYFKFDTADISATAESAISSKNDPQWMVITHYGWRLQFMSMFENVVGLREAEGPDEPLYPWFNAIVITTLVVLFLAIRRFFQIFYRERVQPVIDTVDQEWDEASEAVESHYRGVRGLFDRLRGR